MILKKNISLLFCQIIFLVSFQAQIIFQKTIGGIKDEHNECYNRSTGVINTTNDNGFVLCHSTLSYGSGPFSQGIYFIKLDKNGDTLFTRTYYNSSEHCFGRSVYQTTDGGYILGAAFNTTGAGLVRTDANGNIIWSKKINPFLTGYYGLLLKDNNFLSTSMQILAKVDNSGNLIFGKRYSTGNSNVINFYSSEQCANGDIISVGMHYTIQNDILVMRTDGNGNIKFVKTYGKTNKDEYAYKAIELSDKSIAVIGWNEPSTGGDYNISLLKIDSIGNPIFLKNIGDSYYQWANSIIKDSFDNLYFTGVTTYVNSSVFNQGSAFLIKTDPMGNMLNMFRYDNTEYGNGLVFTNNGELAICGMTSKFGAGGEDLFIVKTNSLGTAGCNIQTQTLAVTNETNVLTNNLNLIVTNSVTLSNYTLSTRPGAQISTLCYSCTPPNVSIVATKSLICPGENVILTATGADTFSWNIGAASNTIQVNLLSTTIYSVIGSTGPQCKANATFTINVSKCLSLFKSEETNSLKVFPIPAKNKLNVECENNIDHLEVFDSVGSLVLTAEPGKNKTELYLNIPGIYYIIVKTNGDLKYTSFVIE